MKPEGPSSLCDPGTEDIPLESLTKKGLVDICQSLALSKRGTKDTLSNSIREFRASAANINSAKVKEKESKKEEESDEEIKSDKGDYNNDMSENNFTP